MEVIRSGGKQCSCNHPLGLYVQKLSIHYEGYDIWYKDMKDIFIVDIYDYFMLSFSFKLKKENWRLNRIFYFITRLNMLKNVLDTSGIYFF